MHTTNMYSDENGWISNNQSKLQRLDAKTQHWAQDQQFMYY